MAQRDLFSNTPREEMTWRDKYKSVISSKRWRKLRERFLAKHDGKCCRCGWHKKPWDKSRTIDLHHKTYERLGEEIDSDLELVCSVCHINADMERANRGRQKAQTALYNAQFDGWATKVYGDDYIEDEYMHERFETWQERKEMEGNQ